jgi:hypothetical protein
LDEVNFDRFSPEFWMLALSEVEWVEGLTTVSLLFNPQSAIRNEDPMRSAKLLPEVKVFFSEELDTGIYHICFIERSSIPGNFF